MAERWLVLSLCLLGSWGVCAVAQPQKAERPQKQGQRDVNLLEQLVEAGRAEQEAQEPRVEQTIRDTLEKGDWSEAELRQALHETVERMNSHARLHRQIAVDLYRKLVVQHAPSWDREGHWLIENAEDPHIYSAVIMFFWAEKHPVGFAEVLRPWTVPPQASRQEWTAMGALQKLAEEDWHVAFGTDHVDGVQGTANFRAQLWFERQVQKGIVRPEGEVPLPAENWPFDSEEAGRRQRKVAEKLGVEVNQQFEIADGVRMDMVLVPAGEYDMGSPRNEAYHEEDEVLHPVQIEEPYYIGKYEVTQRQWEAVMEQNPSDLRQAGKPVENVSWEDCREFVRRVNQRTDGGFALPTEAQWEWACRAGTNTPYYWGDEKEAVTEYAWVSMDDIADTRSAKVAATHPVGVKKPNAWGLHDLAGNVTEWTASPYSPIYDGSELKGAEAPAEKRVWRGAAWHHDPRDCRSADRWAGPKTVDWAIGLRLVRSVR